MRTLIQEELDSLERSSLTEVVPEIQRELTGMREEMQRVRKVSENTYEKSDATHKKMESMEKLVDETREGFTAGLMNMASNFAGTSTAATTTGRSPEEAR